MKKVLLGLILIGALIGVVYLKSERAEQNRARLAEDSFKAGLDKGEDLQIQVDSLAALVNRKDSVLAESVAVHEECYTGTVDSLNELIQIQEQQIVGLSDQIAGETTAAKVVAQNTSEVPDARHLEILNYYKKAVGELPGDLSSYERRVALSEIRNKTASKFEITVAALNSLRKENNLDY